MGSSRSNGSSLPQRRLAAALFDLDDTLYRNHEVPEAVKSNIRAYMLKHLGFEEKDVDDYMYKYYAAYGTTLAGLVAHGHHIDYDHWHAFVHGSLDYDGLLQKDPQLRQCLLSLQLPKHIFTNADHSHVERCLNNLGIADCFEGTVGFESLNAPGHSTDDHDGVTCKPSKEAFHLAAQQLKVAELSEIIFVDDSARNIKAARQLGVYSVFVGDHKDAPEADLVVQNVPELARHLPQLFADVAACAGAGIN